MKFNDEKILSFSDPRCLHDRDIRHAEYRCKEQDRKRSMAIVPRREYWTNLVHLLKGGKNV
jgi:hypothetical protein